MHSLLNVFNVVIHEISRQFDKSCINPDEKSVHFGVFVILVPFSAFFIRKLRLVLQKSFPDEFVPC